MVNEKHDDVSQILTRFWYQILKRVSP